MSEIQIKAESFPSRCEICHQTDCFDAKKNCCSRCGNTSISSVKSLNLFKPDSKLTIQVKLDLPTFAQAQQEVLFSNKFFNNLFDICRIWSFVFSFIMIGGYIYIFLGYCYLIGIRHALYHTPPIMLIAFLLSLFGSIGHKFVFPHAIDFKRLKTSQKNATYTFLHDGFEMTNEKFISKTTWEALYKVVETKHSFIFFISKKERRIVPKHFFNNSYDVECLREVLKTKLGDKIKQID